MNLNVGDDFDGPVIKCWRISYINNFLPLEYRPPCHIFVSLKVTMLTMASSTNKSKSSNSDREVNESFVLLYKFASLVRKHAKERNTFRDFHTILDGKEVTENLLNYIHKFNSIDFSNIKENLEIIKIHWESIRNYLPLLLKYPVSFTDREDTRFLKSLKNSIVFSVPPEANTSSEFIHSLRFNRITIDILKEFVHAHEILGIFSKDEVDIKIFRIIDLYNVALNEVFEEYSTNEIFDEVASIIAMHEY